MPTNKRRVTVNIDEELYEVLKSFTALTNQSMSNMLNDMLMEAYPMLKKTIQLVQAAHDASQEHKRAIHDGFHSAESDLAELRSQLSRLLKMGGQPPYSNRGVHNHTLPPVDTQKPAQNQD